MMNEALVELLVLQVTARELGATMSQASLNSFMRVTALGLRRLPVGRELLGESGIAEHRNVGRHLNTLPP